MNRIGQALLLAGGLALAAFMVYTLRFDLNHSGKGRDSTADVARVAVVYPDRTLWREFRHGVLVCARKRLLKVIEEVEGSILVETARHRRKVRFHLLDVRGLRETKEEVRTLLNAPGAPVAFVGSSNTVLTEAIAQALRGLAGSGGGGRGPVLLVPWASAVLAPSHEPGEGPVALLDINPGRIFRFCPNNQRQADSLVGCLAASEKGEEPARVVVVEDRLDPYSVDLGAAFHRAVERVAPGAEIVERADSLSLPLPQDAQALPGPAEEALAESIWRESERRPGGGTTWVFLPLQEAPALWILNALRRHARREPGSGSRSGQGPLRVVCGDGISFTNLSALAGHCPFPVWCSTSSSAPGAAQALGQGVSPDTQVAAEIVAALVLCLDLPGGRAPVADELRIRLSALKLSRDDPSAMGRSLAFGRSGERVGDDLGHVLMIRTDRPEVFAVERGPSGGWRAPEPLKAASLVVRP